MWWMWWWWGLLRISLLLELRWWWWCKWVWSWSRGRMRSKCSETWSALYSILSQIALRIIACAVNLFIIILRNIGANCLISITLKFIRIPITITIFHNKIILSSLLILVIKFRSQQLLKFIIQHLELLIDWKLRVTV